MSRVGVPPIDGQLVESPFGLLEDRRGQQVAESVDEEGLFAHEQIDGRELPSRDFASETVVGRHRIFEFYAAFRHGLNDLFGDAQHVFGLGREPVAVVDAPPDEPDDLIPGKQYELPCLLRQRDFMVDQVVADLLAAGHAVGNEPVPLLPAAHRERVFEFVGIHLVQVLEQNSFHAL